MFNSALKIQRAVDGRSQTLREHLLGKKIQQANCKLLNYHSVRQEDYYRYPWYDLMENF